MIINNKGYRLGIGIVLMNKDGKLFWAKRLGKKNAWQFPQGGLLPYETVEEAMYRELKEEIGLDKNDVRILSITRKWQHYKLPPNLRRNLRMPLCIGQKQKWFLLQFLTEDKNICLEQSSPEFDQWHWIEHDCPVNNVVFFKRALYASVLNEFANFFK